MHKQRTKGEHYIPNKSYLNYFTDNTTPKKSTLWVYENKQQILTNINRVTAKNISPEKFCKDNYLYESPAFPLNAIENALAELEGKYKIIVDNKLLKGLEITSTEKEVVARYLSALEMRTPLNKQNADEFINQLLEHTIALEEAHNVKEPSELRKELEAALKQNFMFTTSLASAMDFNRYQICDFQILTINPVFADLFFITSDFPVTMLSFTMLNNFYPPTPMDITAETVIPITPQMAILVNNIGENGYKEIDYNFVDEVNSRVLRRANSYIISDRKLTADFISRTRRHFPQSFILLNLETFLSQKRKERFGLKEESSGQVKA
ncbi:hypothetical protein A2274_00050 [candidate division WWE3 bacterium RIFOXYA12_FULL_43_11]|uniref:DUF4238 domain-containing protein n=2 Tax=Katanobacteria TaxID=422282 RepID=A0A0G0VQQ0_UNCKA|nr:MAG: hypothetical protein UR43_C0017G0003 [candidate division TM6 bacterium GW2011_GWF2_33_332]KKS03214.1 MAG: hypothetical protein UU55_C0004G0003 [candidate division WWE3 bacterium GW2011_GWC2_41_23]OGC59204.1 MAG: hypothetical protein A2245_00375 [candidate division WWE3 bacterium RIFOXYA2_FULL_43_12]OGC64482.1 MAG: hypothetical protein A2274_00050 [candidate division WWE3 bacterium RIFOXYA12_FULL_43_11]HBY09770.1 hypothetical protein [candidate division WWE3 bacterium]HLD90701.1 DUF4238